MAERATIAIIGGSGLYRLLDEPERIEVDTPFGSPTAPLTVGRFGGKRVAFLPRHGERHEFPPHRVNYRANLWALRSIGVRRVLAPCAVGSLRLDLDPGTLVVPDQVVDRTTGRAHTYYDEAAVHVGFADPYCPELRGGLLAAAPGPPRGGTLVVIEGPRFSSRAESRWYAAQGWSVVGMTGMPEAELARELALCYAPLAVVTDHDAGIVEGEGVDQDTVFARFAELIDTVRTVLAATVAAMPDERPDCACGHALDGIRLPFALPGEASDG